MFKLSSRPWISEMFAESEDSSVTLELLNSLSKKLRSLSDSQAAECKTDDDFQIFPSLPDAVLEKLGLAEEKLGIKFNDQEMEEKFIYLALAFSIDAATINDRWQRQQRFRDQTEVNFRKEIQNLIEKVQKIQPLCVDAERAELLTNLLAQTDILVKAFDHATIAAERFGAVQYEHRLTQSAHLMINYVNTLKQQRDSARKQLQYTKRVLQHTNSAESMTTTMKQSPISSTASPTLPNGKSKISAAKRRASIATITRPPVEGSLAQTLGAKFTRRTSDLSSRLSSLARMSRPSRLELSADLSKIKEGIAEQSEIVSRKNSVASNKTQSKDASEDEEEVEMENDFQSKNSHFYDELAAFNDIDTSNFNNREKVVHYVRKCCFTMKSKYNTWSDYGVINEYLTIGAIVCFSLSLITLGNTALEMHYTEDRFG